MVWFNDLDESCHLRDWDQLVKALLTIFGPNYYDNLKEALTRLRQTGSMEEYKTQFELLPNRLRGLSNPYKLSCFLSELWVDIHLLVQIFNPINVILAYNLTKIHEKNLYPEKKKKKNPQGRV